MKTKKSVDEKKTPQDRIEILEKKYAKTKGNQTMKLLLDAAREYLTEKGQETNGP
jgi:outer membrane PBP1 activator LpoA protein